MEQEKLNRLKDCWLSVLLDLLLPLVSCPQQRVVLVSSLKETRPPAPQTFDSLSALVQVIQQQPQAGGGGQKKLVSEVEVRFLQEEEKLHDGKLTTNQDFESKSSIGVFDG